MVIKYKIKFDEDAVTISQSVEPSNGKVNDLAGDGLTEKGDGGGDGLTEKGDGGGDGLTEKGDGSGSALGRGRLMAVVLGPLVIGDTGPARGRANGPRESVKNPHIVAVPARPVR